MSVQHNSTIIRQLTLHNFRSFKDLKVNFHENLTVIVAPNGGGKTAVLDAIALSWRIFVATIENREDPKNFPGFSFWDVRRVRGAENNMEPLERASFNASATILGDPGGWSREIASVTRRSRTTWSDATFPRDKGEQLRQHLAAYTQRETDSSPILPVICYYGTGRLWGSQKLTNRRSKPDTSRVSGYIDCFSTTSNFKVFTNWFERFSNEEVLEITGTKQPLHQAGEILKSVRVAVDKILAPSGWHTIEWDFVERALVASHPTQGRLPVDTLSDGIRNMVGLVGDLAHRMARLNPHLGINASRKTPGVVLIDEVDMHLHPSWQQVILGALVEAFPSVQFIVTTHSPQVLTTVPKENIRILRCTDSGESSATIPGSSPLAKESGEALARILGTHVRPEVPELEILQEFEQLVSNGLGLSDRGKNLKDSLLSSGYEFGSTEQRLLEHLHRKSNPTGTRPLFGSIHD